MFLHEFLVIFLSFLAIVFVESSTVVILGRQLEPLWNDFSVVQGMRGWVVPIKAIRPFVPGTSCGRLTRVRRQEGLSQEEQILPLGTILTVIRIVGMSAVPRCISQTLDEWINECVVRHTILLDANPPLLCVPSYYYPSPCEA